MVEKDCEGAVKWFDPRRGYGFIQRTDGGEPEDVYVHHTAIPYKYANKTHARRSLGEGEKVLFDLGQRRRRPKEGKEDKEEVRMEAGNVRGAAEDGQLEGHERALSKEEAVKRRREREAKVGKEAAPGSDQPTEAAAASGRRRGGGGSRKKEEAGEKEAKSSEAKEGRRRRQRSASDEDEDRRREE